MSEPLTPEALVEMKERCARATPGPWREANLGGNGVIPAVTHDYPEEGDWVPICYFSDSKGDGEAADVAANKPFIASARTDLPAALALIADLLDVIDYLAPEIGHEYTTPAWRSVATMLKREGT